MMAPVTLLNDFYFKQIKYLNKSKLLHYKIVKSMGVKHDLYSAVKSMPVY